MKKTCIMLSLIIILIGGSFFYGSIRKNSNQYNNLPDEQVRNTEDIIVDRIKEFYTFTYINFNVDKYNELVIESAKQKNFNNFPDIVKKVEVLEIKNINNPEKHPLLKSHLTKFPNENVRFYLIKYNIEFKKDVATPMDSGTYYNAIAVVKQKNKWVIDPSIHQAEIFKGKLIIGS